MTSPYINLLQAYFDHLEQWLRDMLPEAIFNYVETNMQDDPKKEKVWQNKNLRLVCIPYYFCGMPGPLLNTLVCFYKKLIQRVRVLER